MPYTTTIAIFAEIFYMRSTWFLFFFIITALFSACSPNNVTVDNSLKKYFDAQNVQGCFGMFDNGQGHFTIYNLARFRDSTYRADSTFMVVRNLIAIQTGRMKDEKDTLKAPIGQDTLKHWLDTLGYNPTKITADEQLGLMKKLYFEQLPFFARTQQLVVKTLLREDNSNYKLSYSTSTGATDKGHTLSWLNGWIEENKHLYFFILQLESPDTARDLSSTRIDLLKAILKQYGFMEGKK